MLILKNKSYHYEELKDHTLDFSASGELSSWEKSIVRFVKDWLSDSEFILQQTSGSTGKPKTIKLNKKWMEYSARQTCQYFNLNESHNALLCLPVDYIAGKMMVVRSLTCGFNIYCAEPAGNPFKDIGIPMDFVAITPFQLFQSLDTLEIAPVKTIIVGGGEITRALENEIQNLSVEVFATYGMTETSSHVALRQANGKKRSDNFQVIGDTQISTDERNCLVLENSYLFDGKLFTNDIVEIISKNCFKWLGRFDNIINSGGIKIIPEEIENLIVHLLPDTMVVTSVPDKKLGEAIVLAIETEVISKEMKKHLLQQIKPVLHTYTMPREIICIPEFPKTATGKISRKALKDMIRNKTESKI